MNTAYVNWYRGYRRVWFQRWYNATTSRQLASGGYNRVRRKQKEGKIMKVKSIWSVLHPEQQRFLYALGKGGVWDEKDLPPCRYVDILELTFLGLIRCASRNSTTWVITEEGRFELALVSDNLSSQG